MQLAFLRASRAIVTVDVADRWGENVDTSADEVVDIFRRCEERYGN